MTNHTPGPWEPRYETPGWPWLSIISPDRRRETDANHAVCLLRAWAADPERDANARLITAAPDLLKALQACQGTVAAFLDSGLAVERDFEAASLAAAAIEKATRNEVNA